MPNPTPTPTLEDAILLATVAHRGQTDKAGIAYITHPLRVMSMFVLPGENDERIVAVLHDVVEDCGITLPELATRGYPFLVRAAIDALSKRDQDTYAEYIERVVHCRNPLALRVKLADLRDNLDERRQSTGMLSAETKQKYMDAVLRLSDGSRVESASAMA